jgi:hypothetical protein
MQTARSFMAGLASFACSFVLVLSTYWVLEGSGRWVLSSGIYAVGFVLGGVFAYMFDPGRSLPIGVGAFLAVAVLWTPVVLTTYGFALVAVPLLAVYALLVVLGFRLVAGQRKETHVAA